MACEDRVGQKGRCIQFAEKNNLGWKETLPMEISDDTHVYVVLINAEGQYSLWLKGVKVPGGWNATGKEGLKKECSEYVDQVWTNMQPASLRGHS